MVFGYVSDSHAHDGFTRGYDPLFEIELGLRAFVNLVYENVYWGQRPPLVYGRIS